MTKLGVIMTVMFLSLGIAYPHPAPPTPLDREPPVFVGTGNSSGGVIWMTASPGCNQTFELSGEYISAGNWQQTGRIISGQRRYYVPLSQQTHEN